MKMFTYCDSLHKCICLEVVCAAVHVFVCSYCRYGLLFTQQNSYFGRNQLNSRGKLSVCLDLHAYSWLKAECIQVLTSTIIIISPMTKYNML